MSIRKENKGFTLIEIIVSISIFTVVMLATIGALLTLNDSSRKAQALRTVIDNLNFAVEDMSRKIRTGDQYHCYTDPGYIAPGQLDSPKDCPGEGGPAISLKTQKKIGEKLVYVAYLFSKDQTTGIGGLKVRRGSSTGLDHEELSITSPEIDIKKMEFRVVGAEQKPSSGTQPLVILNISGVVNLQKEKLRTDFSLQTAISSRNQVGK